MFRARPACKGGIGGDSAPAWRRLGAPADYPGPEQCPVLVPGGRLGNGVAAALYIASAWLLACGVAGGQGGGRLAAGPGPPPGRGAAWRPQADRCGGGRAAKLAI